jgi:hypothetical protein
VVQRATRGFSVDKTHGDSVLSSLLPTGTRRGALVAVLGGALGALGLDDAAARHRRNRKGKHKTTCRCPRNRVRLQNDTCAAICAADEDCPANCTCPTEIQKISVEGRRHCFPPNIGCDDIPQTCSSTADCPYGQVCEWTRCLGESYRCIALCG